MRALPHSCLLILLVSLSFQIKVVAYKSAKEGETRETSIGIRGLKRELNIKRDDDDDAILWCLPSFSDVYVFGDGLSDVGNIQALRPSLPSRTGHMNAVQYISQIFGIAQAASHHLTPSENTLQIRRPVGNNYAVEGSRSCLSLSPASSVPDNAMFQLSVQLEALLTRHAGFPHLPDDALYIVFSGRNDIIDVIFDSSSGKINGREARRRLRESAQSLLAGVRSLFDAGARYVLLIGIPSLGDFPCFSSFPNDGGVIQSLASRLTEDFNLYVQDEIDSVECETGLSVAQADIFDVVTRARGSESGKMFLDEMNPSTEMHRFIANAVMKSLGRQACRKGFPEKNMQNCKKYDDSGKKKETS